MKVYTKTGDSGTTSLTGGMRVPKNSPRLEAYGTVDELNGWLGLLHSLPETPAQDKATLLNAMNNMFDLGAILATEPESHWQPEPFPAAATAALEAAIDRLEATLPRHNLFILPGGCAAAAQANIARAVARRAERRILDLPDAGVAVDPEVIKYINRLSDYLFVLSRAMNLATGNPEIYWESPKNRK